MTGCFASDGWQMARFVLFYVALKIIGGEGMEKIENFLMTGFGKMLTLIHVEKNALFCKYLAKMQQVIFFMRFFTWASVSCAFTSCR